MIHYDPKIHGKEAKDLFDFLYKNIKFDKKFSKQLRDHRLAWVNKDIMYAEFLGGNTVGVQPVRFSTRDDNMLMNDLFGVTTEEVYTAVLRLPDIKKEWKVATNPVLQTLCYTMHRYSIDKTAHRYAKEVIQECYYLFSYKVLGSLLSRYFPYNVEPNIAKTAYERLSNRFLIKQLGSWNSVLEYRTKVLLPPKGLHVDRLKKYTTDGSVRIINDLQGSIRENLKAIYPIIKEVADGSERISAVSSMEINGAGDAAVKETTDRVDKYINTIIEKVGNEVNFMDDDVIQIVQGFIKAGDSSILRLSIRKLVESMAKHPENSIHLKTIILSTVRYINNKGIHNEYRKNIIEIIGYMKGYWSSGSVKDKDMLAVKKYLTNVVKTSTHIRSAWKVAATTLALIVYIFIIAVK